MLTRVPGLHLVLGAPFEPGLPPYAQVSRSEAVLHLSEHLGDGSQHGVVRIPVRDITSLREELPARPDARIRPEIDPSAPSGPTMQVIDPYAISCGSPDAQIGQI